MSTFATTLTYNHGNNKLTSSFYHDYILLRYVDFDTNIVYENTIGESIIREYKQLNNFDDVINLVKGAMSDSDDMVKINIPVPTKKCLIVNITYSSKYIPFTICITLNRLQGENTFSGELKKNIIDLENEVSVLKQQNIQLFQMTKYLRKITERMSVPIAIFRYSQGTHYTFQVNPNADILWLSSKIGYNNIIHPGIFNINNNIIQNNVLIEKFGSNNSQWEIEILDNPGFIYVKVLYMTTRECMQGDHSLCDFWHKTLFDIITADTLILNCAQFPNCWAERAKYPKMFKNHEHHHRFEKFKRIVFVGECNHYFKDYVDFKTFDNVQEIYFYNSSDIKSFLKEKLQDKFVENSSKQLCDTLIKEILESKTDFGF